MPGDAAQQERIVVIPSAQPLVVIELLREVHLVAGAAELGAAMQGLRKRLLVERRVGFHQRLVHPVQDRVVAVGEGIVQRLLDRVVAVAARTVQMLVMA